MKQNLKERIQILIEICMSFFYNRATGESICKIDSLTVQMMIYKAEMYILTKYPYLVDLNEK